MPQGRQRARPRVQPGGRYVSFCHHGPDGSVAARPDVAARAVVDARGSSSPYQRGPSRSRA
jgi:hypothetical protein